MGTIIERLIRNRVNGVRGNPSGTATVSSQNHPMRLIPYFEAATGTRAEEIKTVATGRLSARWVRKPVIFEGPIPVIVAETDQTARDYLREALRESEGGKAFNVLDGKLEQVMRDNPDAVCIINQGAPEGIMGIVRSEPARPIVGMTGGDPDGLFVAGCDSFLLKPVNIPDLAGAVKAAAAATATAWIGANLKYQSRELDPKNLALDGTIAEWQSTACFAVKLRSEHRIYYLTLIGD